MPEFGGFVVRYDGKYYKGEEWNVMQFTLARARAKCLTLPEANELKKKLRGSEILPVTWLLYD